jgi:phospholipid-binding lipoprotein MlaA
MRFSLLLATILIGIVTFTPEAQASSFASYTGNEAVDVKADDPWDSVNHPLFDFNLAFDRYLAKPVQSAYHVLPFSVRHSVSNVLTNLSEPLNTVHGVIQLNPKITFTSFWRFILNTTFGFGGLRDFAGEQGLHNMDQNLGKTMGRWGVGAGPYVVLPVLGPSSARDTVGKVGDFFIDPVGWKFTLTEDLAQGVADGIDTRDRQDGIIDQLYYQSLDPYVATRSAFRQHEAFEVLKKER